MTAAYPMTPSALESIQDLMAKALARGIDACTLARESRCVARKARQQPLSTFVSRQLTTLEAMTRLIEDPAARLEEAARERLLGALAYVSEPDDLIPDATPEIGLLDDAIVIDLIARELRPELEAYAAWRQGRQTARCAMHARIERRREQRARRGGLFPLR